MDYCAKLNPCNFFRFTDDQHAKGSSLIHGGKCALL